MPAIVRDMVCAKQFSRKPRLKAAHAIIAWTPASAIASPTCGQVRVGKWIRQTAPNWALAYTELAGATSRVRRSLTEAEALQALRRDYDQLRANGIKPDVINKAFAVIDGWTNQRSRSAGSSAIATAKKAARG